MVRELASLKARMFWNGLRTDRQRQIGLPLILGLALYVAWRASRAHIATLSELTGAESVEYLAWAATLLFIAWVALPVVIFPLDENLDPQQLATLPVPRARLMAGLTAAALISPPLLAVVAVLATTAARRPESWLIAVPSAFVFVVMLVVGSQLFTTLVSAVLRSRRGRDVAVFLIMGIGLASFAGYQTVQNAIDLTGVGTAALAAPIDALWWAIPPAAPAHAISQAWSGAWPQAVMALAVAMGWTAALVMVWERVLSRLLVTPRQESGRSSIRRRNGMAGGPWGVPLVVARKELRFYLRDPRQRLVWTGTVIFVGLAVAAIVVGSEGFAQFRTKAWLPLLAPVMVLMVGLPVALNQFGWERNAASYLFALPANPRSIIVGKNLAALTGLLVETVFLGLLFAWFSSSWRWIGLVLPLAIGAICCLLAVGNVVSVLTPLRLPREGTDVFAQSTEQGFLALASQVVSFFTIGLLLVVPASATVLTVEFGGLLSPWVSVLISIGWGLAWYGGSLVLSGWLLRRRVPEVVGWVQVL